MVPEGWQAHQLGDLFAFKNGHNADNEKYGEGTKFVNVMEIFRHDYLTPDRIRGKVVIDRSILKAYALRYGDVLFNRTSETFDEIAFASVYLHNDPVIFGGFVIRARPTTDRIHPPFARYCFRADTVRRETIRRGQGAIRANIGQADLAQVPLALPPLPEQKKIAEILSTWDEAIETTEKLLSNAESQKRAFMQQLLTGKRRLKAFEGREWKRLKLGSLFRERVERGGDALPLLSITGSRGVVPQDETDRRDTSREDKSSYKKICVGDIGYNTMRMWQGVSARSSLEGLVSPAYTVLIAGPHIDSVFASYLFKLPAQVHWFRRYSQGLTSDTWNLKYRQFAEVPAYIPCLEEQRHIAKIVGMAEEEVQLHATTLAVLRSEKRALIQQLLTGKRRVRP